MRKILSLFLLVVFSSASLLYTILFFKSFPILILISLFIHVFIYGIFLRISPKKKLRSIEEDAFEQYKQNLTLKEVDEWIKYHDDCKKLEFEENPLGIQLLAPDEVKAKILAKLYEDGVAMELGKIRCFVGDHIFNLFKEMI